MGDISVGRPSSNKVVPEPELKPGCRVQLTRLGTERCPKLGIRAGTILNKARNANGFRVQFDGARYPQSLHRSYIMPVDQNGSPRAQ